MLHLPSRLGLLVCSSSLALGLPLPHSSGKVIEPRYIIPGHNTTCSKHGFCPDSQTAAPLKSETPPEYSPVPKNIPIDPWRIPTGPREAVCPDTGLPPPCKPIKHVPGYNPEPTMPHTHQTAPVKCGDSGLPPPCKEPVVKNTTSIGQTSAPPKSNTSASSPPVPKNVPVDPWRIPTGPREAVCPDTGLPPPCKPIKHVPGYNPEPKIPHTHQTSPVKCGGTGLPPPCKPIKHVPGYNPESIIPRTHQTAPVKCGDSGLPPPCKEPVVKNTTSIGQTSAPPKSNTSASSPPVPKNIPVDPWRIPTGPREAVCPDTGLPPPCKPIKHVPGYNPEPTIPHTHQTAPVKCGDTGLPPPCKPIKHVPGYNPERTFPHLHQTAPVKCGDTGLPPPCKPIKHVPGYNPEPTFPHLHQSAPVKCADTGLPPPCKEPVGNSTTHISSSGHQQVTSKAN